MKSINQLRDEIHEIAKSKGFWDKPREIGTLLMLCVSELAEAIEADRNESYCQMERFNRILVSSRIINNDPTYTGEITRDQAWAVNFETCIKDTFEDELADTVIRILDLCGAKGIDIEKHIELKMKYNATREMLHGKKY